jgi:2-methylcitrate dehydratase PrpD
VASSLISGNLGIAQFTEKAVSSPEVREVIERVSVKFDPHLDELSEKKNAFSPSQVRVTLVYGQEYCQTVEEAKGGPNDPLEWPEIEEKFLECSGQLLSPTQAQEVLQISHQLDRVDNIFGLVNLLTTKARNRSERRRAQKKGN